MHHSPVVWITGASAGIGEALAHAWAAEGARVVLSARREDRLRAVQAACAHPDRHLVLPLDVADAGALAPAARQVLDRFGHVDILVLNSGVSQRATAAETDLAVDRRIMEVNYFGAVGLAKAVLPSMLAQGAGHLVVLSSLAGKIGTRKRTAYAASKHALHGFFDGLRAEVYDAGLRVTIVCPGYVRTAISLNALTGDGARHNVMDTTQAQGLSPEACARRILRAVAREKDEVVIAGKERLALYLKRFAPRLLNRIVRKMTVGEGDEGRGDPGSGPGQAAGTRRSPTLIDGTL